MFIFLFRVADDQLLQHIYHNAKTLSCWPKALQFSESRDKSWKEPLSLLRPGTGVSRGNQCPGCSLLAVQPHTHRFPVSASPSWMPMKNVRTTSHLVWDRGNLPAEPQKRRSVSWLLCTAFPVVVVEVWKLESISAFAGVSDYLYTLTHAWNTIISKPMCI